MNNIIFISGAYTAYSYSAIDYNIRKAKNASLNLIKNGWYPITPHLNTCHFEEFENFLNVGYQFWIDMYLSILEKCDGLFLLNGWEKSPGSKQEKTRAEKLNKKIYYQKNSYPIFKIE
jgi:hypothetical protein